MTTIGNIGIGLFILIIVWILALIFFVISVRLASNLGWIGLGIAAAITVILTLIPVQNQFNSPEENIPEEKDYSLIYKYILLTCLSFCAFASVLVVFIIYCIEPVRPKEVKSF